MPRTRTSLGLNGAAPSPRSLRPAGRSVRLNVTYASAELAGAPADLASAPAELPGAPAEPPSTPAPPAVVAEDLRHEIPSVIGLEVPRGYRRAVHKLAIRLIDVTIGLALLLLSLPVALVVLVLIWLDSTGPAIFCQERVGKDGKPFCFHKFRTMRANARERFPDLYSYCYSKEEITTLYFKLADDPRLTNFGTWLRRTSLDELPNLVDVVRGKMALVGPRPEIPEMVQYYAPDQLAKFKVKPGLTGLAQVSGRNILRFQETLGYDLEYVRSQSLLLDLKILARTPLAVIRMLGAL